MERRISLWFTWNQRQCFEFTAFQVGRGRQTQRGSQKLVLCALKGNSGSVLFLPHDRSIMHIKSFSVFSIFP